MGVLDKLLGSGGLGLIGDLAGSLLSSNSARDANRRNIQLQREQQAWEKEMSNTAIQRRAADIEAAGGNRALAFVNGSEASTPSVTPAQVQPIDYNMNFSAKLLAQTQAAATAAQARKTNAEAQLIEADIPYSGKSATARAEKLTQEVKNLSQDIISKEVLIELNRVDWDIKELDYATKTQLAPLSVKAAELLNEANRLGLDTARLEQLKTEWQTYLLKLSSAEAKAAYDFWKDQSAGKWLQFIRKLGLIPAPGRGF